jgi:hypothetical protein
MEEIAGKSRFAGLARWQAWLVAAFTAALIVASFSFPMPPKPVSKTVNAAGVVDSNPDLTLYRTITTQVAAGGDYYKIAAHEQRIGDYPLRPFVTFRLPTLALISATLGFSVMHGLMWLLSVAVVLAWWIRLKGEVQLPNRRLLGTMLIVSGLTLSIRQELVVVHDVWAGLLIALALALHRAKRWWPAALLGLCAVLIRETALPFILLMGAFAAFHRHWREAAAWSAIVGIFAIAMIWHASQVAAVVNPQDPASQGWTNFGGWPFFVLAVRLTTALRGLPVGLGGVLIPIALLGWASWRSRTGLVGTMLFAGYALILMALGRPDNFYWGLMIAPTFLLGLAFLPVAIGDLWAALKSDPKPA